MDKDAGRETRGMLMGLVGVAIFSLTLPMTRVAVREIDPVLVGLGRALVAAVLAAGLLAATRQPWPTRAQWKSLALVALGVIVGFPVFSSIAMRSLPASHGAVMNGLLPVATALLATWRGGERPSRAYWFWAVVGSLLVAAFAGRESGGSLQAGDAAMLAAILLGALGYAEGGKLAASLGGWQVICWALVLSAPVLAAPVLWLTWQQPVVPSAAAWATFAYVAVFSQFLGFFAWYHGLALGGIARVGQVQLLQVFMTLGFAALLFGERVDPVTWLFAGAVLATVVFSRRSAISRPAPARSA
jgi:drug/metabolite transporter (DMT)-like permease